MTTFTQTVTATSTGAPLIKKWPLASRAVAGVGTLAAIKRTSGSNINISSSLTIGGNSSGVDGHGSVLGPVKAPGYKSYTSNSAATALSNTLNTPVTVGGDFLFVHVASDNVAGQAITAPDGYTFLTRIISNTIRSDIYYHVVTSDVGAISTTWGFLAATNSIVAILNYSGVSAVDTCSAYSDISQSAIVTPGVLTQTSNDVLINIGMVGATGGQVTYGQTPRYQTQRTLLSSATFSASIFDELVGAHGATGSRRNALTAAPADYLLGHLVALSPNANTSGVTSGVSKSVGLVPSVSLPRAGKTAGRKPALVTATGSAALKRDVSSRRVVAAVAATTLQHKVARIYSVAVSSVAALKRGLNISIPVSVVSAVQALRRFDFKIVLTTAVQSFTSVSEHNFFMPGRGILIHAWLRPYIRSASSKHLFYPPRPQLDMFLLTDRSYLLLTDNNTFAVTNA